MIVTILAYKSDGVDVCHGCVMAHYSSDFQWKSSMDRGDRRVPRGSHVRQQASRHKRGRVRIHVPLQRRRE